LEAQNKVLKEKRSELKAEVDILAKLVREHRKCENKEMKDWVGEQKTEKADSEFELDFGLQNKSVEGLPGRRRSTSSAQDDGENAQTEEDHPLAMATASGTTLNVQTQTLASESHLASSSYRNNPQSQNDSITALMDMNIDMTQFIEDDSVLELSSSRKTSTASTDFDLDFEQAVKKAPSPADSGVDMTSDVDMSYGKAETGQGEELRVVGLDEKLIPNGGIFSMCHFGGQQMFPRAELATGSLDLETC
jgi:hypothetical protein